MASRSRRRRCSRSGEFIKTSGTKGTVEKISIRSVTLCNSSGS
ncbi:mechanosensitive ion channel domain-containing protein [Mesorhizobium sp.]